VIVVDVDDFLLFLSNRSRHHCLLGKENDVRVKLLSYIIIIINELDT